MSCVHFFLAFIAPGEFEAHRSCFGCFSQYDIPKAIKALVVTKYLAPYRPKSMAIFESNGQARVKRVPYPVEALSTAL